MANVKISALPTASTPLAGTELVPIVQGGITSQTTVDNLLNPLAETNGSSLVAYLPSGTGAVATTVQTKLREIVSVKDFGAVGDGVTDDTAAINAAITYTTSLAYKPAIFFPAGIYKITSTLNLTANNIRLVGEETTKLYGTAPLPISVLSFQFVGVGINTYVGSVGVSYIGLKNLGINGNSQLTYGFDGGFVQQLENVSIVGCTSAGARLTGQTCTFINCSFNNNRDGIEFTTGGGTYTFETCNFRQNTRYGIYGTFGSSQFKQCIFEDNVQSGAYITGGGTIYFDSSYFEDNDDALGTSGYNVKVVGSNFVPYINFSSCTFGSEVGNKIAYLENCSAMFDNCSQVGQPIYDAITATATSKVITTNSFTEYSTPTYVVNTDPVFISQDSGLYIGSGYLSSVPAGTNFGTGDFTVSFAVQILDKTNAIHAISGGLSGAMTIDLLGSNQNINVVNIKPLGGSDYSIAIQSVSGRIGVVTIVRSSGTVHAYFNGKRTFTSATPNTANFSSNILYLGYDGSAYFLNGFLYKFCAYSAALTADEVFNLYKNGTNPVGVRTTNLVLNINNARRPSATAYESVNSTNLTFNGTMNWLNPTS